MLLTDNKFGRLRIIQRTASETYLCRCDCGNTIELWKSQLWCGVVRHCGCILSSKQKAALSRRGLTMASRHVRTYRKRSGKRCTRTTWEMNSFSEMNLRCYCATRNPEMYANYGGRGIRVCERWRRGRKNPMAFRHFLGDLGPRPQGTTLDRINPQGHYEPTNTRWSTADIQASNQRRFIWKDAVLCHALFHDSHRLDRRRLFPRSIRRFGSYYNEESPCCSPLRRFLNCSTLSWSKTLARFSTSGASKS
jgi:hypothetical protein